MKNNLFKQSESIKHINIEYLCKMKDYDQDILFCGEG